MAESDRVRIINRLDGTGTLSTLADGDGTPITAMWGLQSWLFKGNRLYYTTSGGLYCRWKGTSATQPADCNGTLISPPAGLPGFGGGKYGGMTLDENGDILLAAHELLLKYHAP